MRMNSDELARAQAYSDAYMDGYKYAAKRSSAWCIENHGEVFKLGDRVFADDIEGIISAFRAGNKIEIKTSASRSLVTCAGNLTHFQPDSWEKLQGDMDEEGLSPQEVFDRAKKLPRDDDE